MNYLKYFKQRQEVSGHLFEIFLKKSIGSEFLQLFQTSDVKSDFNQPVCLVSFKSVCPSYALPDTPHSLHISQQLPKKRMTAKRGRIAHQQQLAPCAGHAHVHAADVGQEADLALGVAARQSSVCHSKWI
nr:hypothetical protein [Limnohabitans sp. WS1]